MRSAKVDWNSKNVKLEFDESAVSAQKLAQLISATPHMMGGNLRYAGWLALKVPSVTDAASGKTVQEAASKIAGVKQVAVYPAQHSIGVLFDKDGNLTSQQVIDALDQAGIKASHF